MCSAFVAKEKVFRSFFKMFISVERHGGTASFAEHERSAIVTYRDGGESSARTQNIHLVAPGDSVFQCTEEFITYERKCFLRAFFLRSHVNEYTPSSGESAKYERRKLREVSVFLARDRLCAEEKISK